MFVFGKDLFEIDDIPYLKFTGPSKLLFFMLMGNNPPFCDAKVGPSGVFKMGFPSEIDGKPDFAKPCSFVDSFCFA